MLLCGKDAGIFALRPAPARLARRPLVACGKDAGRLLAPVWPVRLRQAPPRVAAELLPLLLLRLWACLLAASVNRLGRRGGACPVAYLT